MIKKKDIHSMKSWNWIKVIAAVYIVLILEGVFLTMDCRNETYWRTAAEFHS